MTIPNTDFMNFWYNELVVAKQIGYKSYVDSLNPIYQNFSERYYLLVYCAALKTYVEAPKYNITLVFAEDSAFLLHYSTDYTMPIYKKIFVNNSNVKNIPLIKFVKGDRIFTDPELFNGFVKKLDYLLV